MDLFLGLFILIFAIAMWIPFLNNVYSQDIANAVYLVDRSIKGQHVMYEDHPKASIGHFFLLFIIVRFCGKYNTKVFYRAMCLYTSLSAFVLFLIISHLFGQLPAFLGSLLFSIYIVSPRIDGNWGSFEQLIPLPLFLSLFCIIWSSGNPSNLLILLSGSFFGYAILVKQVVLLYYPGFSLMLFGTGHSFSFHLYFICGVIFINAIPLMYYWLRYDALFEYLIINWLSLLPSALRPTKYNNYYPRVMVRGQKDKNKYNHIISISRSLLLLYLMSIVGSISLLFHSFSVFNLGLFLCLIASAYMISMRGTFFPHYWLNMIPWLSLFSGVAIGEIIIRFQRFDSLNAIELSGILVVIYLLFDAVRMDSKYYFVSKDPYGFLKRIWGQKVVDTYKSWEEIGRYIKNSTMENDKILVCGWTPHILLYSDRTHFTNGSSLYAEDYLDIYNRDNPSLLSFLFDIYSFKGRRPTENVFHVGYPEVIVFSEGNIDIKGFENLTGIKYTFDENAYGYPIFRADMKLTMLMSTYEQHIKSDSAKPDSTKTNINLFAITKRDDISCLVADFKRYLETHPSDAESLLQFGIQLMNANSHRLLFNFFKRLIEDDMVDDKVKLQLMNQISESFFLSNETERAEKIITEILQKDPNNVSALNNFGVIRFNQNRKAEAKTYFKRVLDIDPSNKDAIINLNAI